MNTLKAKRAGSIGQGGFTLMELLVVLAILGLLMSLVGPRVLNQLGGAKTKTAAIQVKDAMVTDVTSVSPDTPVSEIASLMVVKHFHTIPVVRDKKLVGIIGKEDILKTLMQGQD